MLSDNEFPPLPERDEWGCVIGPIRAAWMREYGRAVERAAYEHAAQEREPLSDSDADYWLRNRQAILDAIRREGFVLMSNACGFWLKRMDKVSEAHGIGGSDAE